jgi:hydrogenase nickel incorporation protein HypA/HybF
MHELSIAYNLVETAAAAAHKAGVLQVVAVHLRLGVLSGISKEALLFSYDLATDGSLLAGSRLVIEDIPVIIFCSQCQTEQTLLSIQRFCCPVCGSPSADIRQGRELDIVGLEVCDGITTPATTSA